MSISSEFVIIAAMKEEAAPLLAAPGAEPLEFPVGEAWRVTMDGVDVVVVQSGVGLVNATTAATHAIRTFSPTYLLTCGSAGGLAQGIFVGDIIVGTAYSYADADATAFGYEFGQLPGLPRYFDADPDLVELGERAHRGDQRVLAGKIVSGNSFVDARTVDTVRSRFPGALAADMESAALAQVAFLHGIRFVSVRAISDLCGPEAGNDFSIAIDEVATRAAAVVHNIVAALPKD